MECPDLLSGTVLTPSQQLSILTRKLQSCLMSREACQWPPSAIAVSLLSLELEQFRPDWFQLIVSLLKSTKV